MIFLASSPVPQPTIITFFPPSFLRPLKISESNVKICFLTASELFYEEYRRLDAYPSLDKAYFIQKPFRAEQLIRKINEIMHSN
jgi:hypothetical protein